MNMKAEMEFPQGLIFKAPRDGAPEYVLGGIAIKRDELIQWLAGRTGEWVNLEVKRSQNGKVYVAVDNWKPKGDAPKAAPRKAAPAPTGDVEDEIPF